MRNEDDEFALETPRRESALEGFLISALMGVGFMCLWPLWILVILFMPSPTGAQRLEHADE